MQINRADPTEAKKTRKPRTPTKSAEKRKTPKRKRAIVESGDDSEDDMTMAPIKRTKKLQRTPVPPPTIGGKYVGRQEIFTLPARQTLMAKQTIIEADLDQHSRQFVGFAAANAAALAQMRNTKLASIDSSAEADTVVPAPVVAEEDAVVGVGSEEWFTPGAVDETLLPAYYPAGDPVGYYYGGGSPAPVFQSRFDALAEHRRFVKDLLRDIEPGLDWSEGPWPEQKSELLWGGEDKMQYGAMFST
jgi:hypothetical protein